MSLRTLPLLYCTIATIQCSTSTTYFYVSTQLYQECFAVLSTHIHTNHKASLNDSSKHQGQKSLNMNQQMEKSNTTCLLACPCHIKLRSLIFCCLSASRSEDPEVHALLGEKVKRASISPHLYMYALIHVYKCSVTCHYRGCTLPSGI